jgi:hypothetical protein
VRSPKNKPEDIMKLRIIKFTPEYFVSLLQGKQASFTQNLPSDAEILSAKMDLFAKQISLVVRSDSFADVVESMPIPELTLSASEPEVGSKPAIIVKTEVLEESKPLIPKPTKPPLSRYASKMENEFTPDQQKLLNFSVKDDYVIVKPVTFLKTEWDDINEVVRSLGGKWVKGDIISYWEIPLQ